MRPALTTLLDHPRFGSRLARAHVRAKKLEAFFLFNEAAGACVDLVRGVRVSTHSGATRERGLRCDAADEGAEITTPTHLQLQPPLTVAARVKILGTPTNNASIFGVTHNNTDSSPFESYQLAIEATGKFVLNFNNGVILQQASSSVAPVVGEEVTLVGVVVGGATKLYRNGVEIASNAAAIGSLAYGASTLLCAGDYTGISRTTNMRILWGGIWSRALTQDETRRLHLDPYPHVERPGRTVIAPASSAAPTFRRTSFARAGSRGVLGGL